jgi:hypothetical protein
LSLRLVFMLVSLDVRPVAVAALELHG